MAFAQKTAPRKGRAAFAKLPSAGSFAKGAKGAPKKAGPAKAAAGKARNGLGDREDAALINAVARSAAADLLKSDPARLAQPRPAELCDWEDADLINEVACVAARLTLGK